MRTHAVQQTATSFKSFKHLASERVQLARTARAPYPPRFLDSIVLSIEVPLIFDHQDSRPLCVREAFFEAQSCQWRHFELLAACPLYPKADLCSATRDVRFVPIADIVTHNSWSPHGAANSVGGTVRPNGAGLSCVRNARRARWSARGKAERKLAALATTKGTIGLWKFIKSLR